MATSKTARTLRRVALTAALDREEAEALRLEIRRLAKRCGVELASLRVERVARPGAPSA